MTANEKDGQAPPHHLANDMAALRVEVDRDTGGDPDHLPTYGELQQAAPPNSRFGRWKGWIDKRAAERFSDQTPEERRARQQRLGWGEGIVDSPTDVASQSQALEAPEAVASTSFQPTPPELPQPPAYPSPTRFGDPLSPTSAAVYTFGSRFLSHSEAPIQCLLPIVRDRFLLIGTAEGLGVLDVLPRLHGQEPLATSAGLDGARAREIWTGCGVLQCALLEDASGPLVAEPDKGIVLALVATQQYDATGRCETVRQLRMYNLESLVNLVKWTVTQKESAPLDVGRSAAWETTPTKKQRNRLSKMMNLLVEGPDHRDAHAHGPARTPSPQPRPLPPVPPSRSQSLYGRPKSRASANSHAPSASGSWDAVEDLPLRWATDFEPFQHAKITGNVSFFELWRSQEHGNYGRTMLAVGTSKSIVLFEAPRGERAFTFVKDYYTPHPAKSARFVYQLPPDNRTSASHHHRPSISRSRESLLSDPGSPSSGRARRISQPAQPSSPQLSLFLTFDKKAVIIRLSDAAVGEIDTSPSPESSASSSSELSPTHSLNNHSSKLHKYGSDAIRESKWGWAPLVQLYLPTPTHLAATPHFLSSERLYYFITRGKYTYAFACPLSIPVVLSHAAYVFAWTSPPRDVAGRVVIQPDGNANLQLVAFGSEGVEILETPVTDILSSPRDREKRAANGKGRPGPSEPRRAFAHEGFSTGFLCSGGEWDRMAVMGNVWRASLARAPLLHRSMSDESIEERPRVSDAGVYGWLQKTADDYRVFWVGSPDATEI